MLYLKKSKIWFALITEDLVNMMKIEGWAADTAYATDELWAILARASKAIAVSTTDKEIADRLPQRMAEYYAKLAADVANSTYEVADL